MLPVNDSLMYYFPHGLPEGFFLTSWDKVRLIAAFAFVCGWLCRAVVEYIRNYLKEKQAIKETESIELVSKILEKEKERKEKERKEKGQEASQEVINCQED